MARQQSRPKSTSASRAAAPAKQARSKGISSEKAKGAADTKTVAAKEASAKQSSVQRATSKASGSKTRGSKTSGGKTNSDKTSGKASSGAKPAAGPSWRTKWPQTADLAAWFRCGLEKCAAIEHLSESATEAHLPIHGLAEIGQVKEALKHVDRYLKLLSQQQELDFVRMAELGATICVEQGDLESCEKYLARVLDADRFVKRPCDKGYPARSVHEFRVSHGLIDPSELTDPAKRLEAEFNRAERLRAAAQAKGDTSAANRHLREMYAAIREPLEPWRRRRWIHSVLESAQELHAAKFVKEVLASVPKSEWTELVGYQMLAEVGQRKEAVAAATNTLQAAYDELVSMTDPNIHFPVNKICRALEFLAQLGEKKLAAQWLKKVTSSVKTWKCVILGWTTTAVLTSFVPIVEILEGKEAALELAQLAQEHASQEEHRDFKRGAMASALEATASVSSIDAAVELARKLRSPTQRRMELAKLLARAGRFKELRAVCSEVASPAEAAKIAWWVKFELPGVGRSE